MKHTILGAGGSVGNALAYELLKTDAEVLLVSRSNYTIPGTKSIKCDLTSFRETYQSVKNSDIVYLCAGLPYDSRIWADYWPRIMQNSMDACERANARLIFFDNVYMYGKVKGKMIESTPYNPCSRKGETRTKMVMLLESEIYKKNINALIARSADLYGPYATKTSIPYILAINRLLAGKRANWMISDDKLHSYSYTGDCAKGLILLSKNENCFNQTWHLPTYNPGIDGKTLIQLIANELAVDPKYSILKKWMIQLVGLFNRTVFESIEMLYQSESDYYFDSTKFNDFFGYNPKPYKEGIHETIEFIRKNQIGKA